MNTFAALVFVAGTSIAHAGPGCPADYGQRLMTWLAADQAIRSVAGSVIVDQRRLINAMEALGGQHARQFRALLKRCGWPDQRKYGEEVTKAAWMLAQHADDGVGFQEEALSALRRAAERGAAPRRHVAYLADRIRVHRGQPQLFGTQLRLIDGRMTPEPIADEGAVDQRRASHDLRPLADYVAEAQRRFDVRWGVALGSYRMPRANRPVSGTGGRSRERQR